MPYIKGTATDYEDLLSQLCAWVTDSAIHGADAWEIMQQEPWPKGTIIKAHGWDAGEHFYLGFMPKKIILGQTYKEWFLEKNTLLREYVWADNGLRLKPENTVNISGNTIAIQGTQRTITFKTSEIFYDSAWPMFLGAFKQFSPGLDWVEQAGGYTPKPKIFPLLIRDSTNPMATGKFYPPPFPGVGFPAMSMDADGPISGVVQWWATKDRHRIILAVNNSGQWEVAHLGFLEAYHKPNEYACPLCVIGGTSGARTMGQSIFFSSAAKYPTPTMGFRFDYTTKNRDLGRGLPTYAASPGNDRDSWTKENYFSQVQLMMGDGTWKSFFNWLSQEQVITESCGESVSYYYAKSRPERNSATKSVILPTNSNVGRLKHVLTDSADSFLYSLLPIELAHGTDSVTSQADTLGILWRMYWPSSQVLRYGEATLSGKKHLVVPNSYEGRMWWLPHGKTGITDVDALALEYNEVTEMNAGMSCVIRLED